MLGIVGLAAWARRPFSFSTSSTATRQMSPSSYLPTACTSRSTRSSIPPRLSRKRRHLSISTRYKYEGWSRELKAIYDSFPHLHVRFTGSSVLDIEKGEADLSRRAPKYHLQGLLLPRVSPCATTSAASPTRSRRYRPQGRNPRSRAPPLFREYLASGYYPFGSDPEFEIELGQVIMRTLEVDIPILANMNAATGRKLKRLMALISTIPPLPSMAKALPARSR